MTRIRKLGAAAALAAAVLAPVPALASAPTGSLGPSDASGAYVDPDGALLVDSASYRPPVFVVGDSMTWRSYYVLRSSGVPWEVSAFPGREVAMLPELLRDRLANPSPLSTVVVELGTNASAGWTEGSLRAAVALLPASTRVVLVTPYRGLRYVAANGYGYKDLRKNSAAYATWYRRLAAARPRACVAEWRPVAAAHHELMVDGIHPTFRGKKVLVSLVERAVARCR